MLTNIFIFSLKIIENTLSTLRLIVVSNGKKKLGALLNGIISLIWIFSTSIIIININKDIFSIISFILGASVGSYLGSILEEKIALGNIALVCRANNINEIMSNLNKVSKIIITDNVLLIYLKRKNKKDVINIIKLIDSNAYILTLKARKID